MNKSTFHTLIIILTFIGMPIMKSCQIHTKKQDMVISTSILPLKFFIDRLTEESIEVNVMVPPGASHSSYSPTPRQFKKLSDSGLYIRIGYLGYEQAWIGRLRELNPTMDVLALSDHIELIHGGDVDHGDHKHEGGVDPHIWMSPKIMIQLLPLIRDAIIQAYPDLRGDIEKNYPVLAAEIAVVDQEFAHLSDKLTQNSFMIYHPALTYLARDYGFNQISIEHEGKEPSPAMLSRIIRDAREFSIPVIFIQEEYDMRSAELIGKETGAKLEQINPMAYNWIESMQGIQQSFTDNLQ
jgi:zinc transport system substrate-binding protein